MDFLIDQNNILQTKDNVSPASNKTIDYSDDYEVDKRIHIIIIISSVITGVILMSTFWANRNYYLIRYRGFRTAFAIGCGSFINMAITPFIFYFELPCYINFIVNSIFSSLAMILMTSRYMKIIILNKQNLIKSNFLDINMKESKRKLSEPQYNENESNKQVYFIIEPNEFIKHYDDLITMKVTNIISASVFSIIFVLIIVVFFIAWDDLWGKCTSKSWIIFLPVMIATFFSLLFNIYTLLYSLKNLSFEKILDISLCNFGTFLGIILYILSKIKIIKFSSASYFFYSPFIFCIISCNIIPLVELFWSKYITKKKKVSKTEFIKLLTSKKYIEIMKVYSIKYLCVENILFWELNMKLLKKVCSDYYDEIKQIRKVESFSRKFSSCSSNNNKLATLNELDCTNTSIIRTAECDESYTEQSSIRRNSAATEDYNYNNGEFNKKKSIVQSSKEDNQAFPSISYDTFNRNDDNYTDVKPNNYFDTLIMENSCNVNIFSNASNSSNVYESESSDLSSKKSQSFEVKLNIESSDIKKIVFDQIFKELVIPEVFWTTIFKKMISIDEKYIEYYNKIYDIYINPQGVVPLKISLNNVKVIGSKINRSEYSHDMFFPILNEVASLIYEHVYLNLDI